MRIVIDARESGTSTGRYIDKLIEYLAQLKPGHDIVVLTKTHRVSYLAAIGPHFEIIETPYKEFSFGEQWGFKKQIEQLKPDLVHFGMTQQPVLYGGRVVTTMHDLTTIRFRNPAKNALVFTAKQQLYRWGVKRVAKKSRLIIANTEFVKRDLSAYTAVDPAKIIVIPLAADKITERPVEIAELTEKKFILYVGRPQPHKNLRRLMDAFVVMKKQVPDLYLALIGKHDKAFAQLEAYVAQEHIRDVIFTGFVPDGGLRWAYEHAVAYVFPSLSEGFGLPGLEAMQYNLPVVSSNATCLPEVYKNAALYFEPKNTEDIAEKVVAVVQNPKLAKTLAQEGTDVLKQYSWQKMATQTLAVYEKALNQSE